MIWIRCLFLSLSLKLLLSQFKSYLNDTSTFSGWWTKNDQHNLWHCRGSIACSIQQHSRRYTAQCILNWAIAYIRTVSSSGIQTLANGKSLLQHEYQFGDAIALVKHCERVNVFPMQKIKWLENNRSCCVNKDAIHLSCYLIVLCLCVWARAFCAIALSIVLSLHTHTHIYLCRLMMDLKKMRAVRIQNK